jgi:hypothetical protein
MRARDPAAARQWVTDAPFTPEMKSQLQSLLEKGIAPAPATISPQ